MKKRTLFLLLASFGILLTVAGAVYAYFSSTASSVSNTFKTNEMRIVLSDTNENKLTSVTDSWDISTLEPGMQLPQSFVKIVNTGQINGDHIDIQFSYEGDEEFAKSFIMLDTGNGFRYGDIATNETVNLITALKGGSDVDYVVTNGSTGAALTTSSVDGIDGTTKDGQISLSELAAFGKIRISPGDENRGIAAGTTSDLWLNAMLSPNYSIMNGYLDMTITVSLDQSPTQF